jgi:hypothetical protein
MSVSAMDTAKLPRSCTEPPAPLGETARAHPSGAVEAPVSAEPGVPATTTDAPATDDPVRLSLASVAEPVPPVAGRRALREERRQHRRQQRLYAAAGIAVLAAVFIVAVVVLGGVR